MSNRPAVVLKFGGSVLLSERHLPRAVHEVYRWRRAGNSVVVVVSALAGRTEELLEQSRGLEENATDYTRAELISSGEFEATDLLVSQLDRAGVPAKAVIPEDFEFIASGPALDATPCELNADRLQVMLKEFGVIVVPGFVAVDPSGARVTLGRGGSDLSAICIASQIGARTCRLIKDVDGLYDQDPSKSTKARRFETANYDDALSTDGTIIQHKAVQAARQWGVEFELGAFNSISPSQIGKGQRSIKSVQTKNTPIRVALCGLGTVGRGVLELLQKLPDEFVVSYALCRTPEKHTELMHRSFQVVDDFDKMNLAEVDVVVELIGGTTDAHLIAKKSIAGGCHYVTANKSLVAEFGDELQKLADHEQVYLGYAASVGGSVPVIEFIRSLGGKNIQSVSGVLNGSANFILCALERGVYLEDAIAEAQRNGFAEADPTRDISGQDSMDKLLVLSKMIGWDIDPTGRIQESIADWHQSTRDNLFPVRHIAHANKHSASVCVQQVSQDSSWGHLQDEWNGVLITCTDGSKHFLRGKGAGRYPTSESVLSDLFEIHRRQQAKQVLFEHRELAYV